MKKRAFKVYELNNYLKHRIEEDVVLNNILVEGEISNFKAHSSGHLYFTLKDSKGALNSIMFKSYAEGVQFKIENGQKVLVTGYLSLYEKTGQVQLYCENIEPLGKGSLYVAFSQLKEKLDSEGLFSLEYKKKLPKYAKNIAVLTSPTGAAVKDIINVATRRNDQVNLFIVPVLVQGENAKTDIVKAIEMVNRWNKADLIILGRGGGSIEDLWAFNEEVVARAIFNSDIPIISAVGHETDFTIADFVSDFRAPTPSAAAEIAVFMKSDAENKIKNYANVLETSLDHNFERYRQRLNACIRNKYLAQPEALVTNLIIHLENMQNKIINNAEYALLKKRMNFNVLLEKLKKNSPIEILNKGFVMVEDSEGNIIKSRECALKNDSINLKFYDGMVKAKIVNKE